MYERILVSVDGSEPSNLAIHEAAKLASSCHANVRLVSVVSLPTSTYLTSAYTGFADFTDIKNQEDLEKETTLILDTAQITLKQIGIDAETQRLSLDISTKDIADTILRAAQDWRADLIVLGTHGHRGVTRLLLGSVAETLLRITTVPLLLIKAQKENE
ncbi:universal stress protein [Candidatus Pandoraea novymonadis]|uniref:Universal stress protein n=1 Tax=Candidatus Pandoraea novymonadis TaxID=1808959 RepID=A0ABX5FF16_9BURK|nr:universal stress protein [Candidatus Pandoraea novymonadis]PSB92301.1 Stress response protein NhaX [Candidatus Pandoraea novymonadis]